jgi:hypothetical protein
MTQPTPGHRQIVAAAIRDWWITTDPCQPFNSTDAADQVDMYLRSSGYVITPDIPRNRMPTRADITFTTVLLLAALGGTLQSLITRNWLFTAVCAPLTFVLIRDLLGDLAERRYHHHRNNRT